MDEAHEKKNCMHSLCTNNPIYYYYEYVLFCLFGHIMPEKSLLPLSHLNVF